MSLLRLIVLVIPFGLNTVASSAAIGLIALDQRQRRPISRIFALFEGGCPAVGLLPGEPLGKAIGGAADYIAITNLIGFGLFTLLSDPLRLHGSQNRSRFTHECAWINQL